MRSGIDNRKEVIETLGSDLRFLKKIGLDLKAMGIHQKQAIKLYIPKYDIELFQTLSIYFKINQTSISRWVRNHLRNFARDLIEEDDPVFKEAINLHRELKRKSYEELLKDKD